MTAAQQPQRGRLFTPPQGGGETSLVGNVQLPVAGRTITQLPGRGNYDVSYNGSSVGTLRRGGPNGIFQSNGATIQRGLNLQPQQPPGQPTQLGAVGATSRQYAPNMFQQQMMQAQAIRNRPIK